LSMPGELWTAHLIGLAVLILFMAGWWTRITSVLALVVFLSDIHRAPMIAGRTESVAAMVMCYLCLAPCGRRYSLDRLLARRAAVDQDLSASATIATRLIQIHLALLVAMMGFSKLLGEVWWSGGGVWWLIARPESRSLDLTWLYATPKVIDFWTHAVVLFELGFPVLIWVPLARPLVLAIAAVVWTSLALITGETTFALMLMIASMAFISPDFLRACLRTSHQSTAEFAH
jgi:energy-converting hydrogenase Eha subunit E